MSNDEKELRRIYIENWIELQHLQKQISCELTDEEFCMHYKRMDVLELEMHEIENKLDINDDLMRYMFVRSINKDESLKGQLMIEEYETR